MRDSASASDADRMSLIAIRSQAGCRGSWRTPARRRPLARERPPLGRRSGQPEAAICRATPARCRTPYGGAAAGSYGQAGCATAISDAGTCRGSCGMLQLSHERCGNLRDGGRRKPERRTEILGHAHRGSLDTSGPPEALGFWDLSSWPAARTAPAPPGEQLSPVAGKLAEQRRFDVIELPGPRPPCVGSGNPAARCPRPGRPGQGRRPVRAVAGRWPVHR